MLAKDYFELGYIIKPHAIAGEVQVNLQSDEPEAYKKLESVFVEINQKLIPFFIEKITINKNKALIKFEDVDSVAQAETFSGKILFLPLSQLPPLAASQFYYHDIIGFEVKDTIEGLLGKIIEVVENPGNDLLVMEYKGKEVLIPITDSIVTSVDKEKHLVQVSLPQGLLDLYLE